jgi:hypothetical protein
MENGRLTLLTRCEISENEANNHRECTVAVVVTGSPPNLMALKKWSFSEANVKDT